MTPKRGESTPKTTGRTNNASRKNGKNPVKLSGDSVDSGLGTSASTTPVKKLLKRSERDTPDRKKKTAKTQTNHQKNEKRSQETLNTDSENSVTSGKKLIQTKLDVTCTSDLSSGISSTCDSFCIVDVASHHELFNEFIQEWKTKSRFSLCLACEKVPPAPITGGGIGGNFNKGLFLKKVYVEILRLPGNLLICI